MELNTTSLGWIYVSTVEIKYFQYYHFAYLLPPPLHTWPRIYHSKAQTFVLRATIATPG